MFFTRLLKQLTFYDLFIYVVNVACFSFVFWKTSECIIKFLDNPRGTKMDIWYTENTDNFPAITICSAANNDGGMRWNTEHLKQCGISGEKLYQDEAKWSGYGEINCTDPKLLLEAIVVKLESMMPFIKVEYFDTLPEVTTEKDMKNQWTTYDGTDGRCYSFTPTMKMIKRGIAKIEMTFNMPVKIYIHTPGKYATARKGTKIKNVMGRESKVQVSHELFYTLDDAGKPCIQDSTYNKDLCMFAAFEKTVEKYGCTTPFGMSGNIKDKICKGKENDNATEVFKIHKTWFDEKDVHFSKSCPNPCHIILTAAYRAPEFAEKIGNGTSQIKLLFNNRVKIINDYQLYSGLSLLAEIGGYFGLFLGVSINQITKFISIVRNWITSYYTKWN